MTSDVLNAELITDIKFAPGMEELAWTWDVALYSSYSNDVLRLLELFGCPLVVRNPVTNAQVRASLRNPRKLRIFLQNHRPTIVDTNWVCQMEEGKLVAQSKAAAEAKLVAQSEASAEAKFVRQFR